MRCRISIFIYFLFLFTVKNNTYASNVGPVSVLTNFSKFFVSKFSPKLSYEIDLNNRLLINLTSTFTVSYGVYKYDFFSVGLGLNVKWLDLLVRIVIRKKNYFIPIEFLNIHIITLDFYYVNVYFLKLAIYDLIWLATHNTEGKKKEFENESNKREKVFTGFSFLNPVFQLNLNRIFSDFFYSEKDVL